MENVIPLVEQLIACPSVTPNDANCQMIIKNRLNQAGFHCESFRFENVDNLWAKYGEGNPLLVFLGHTDVVPEGPLADWIVTSPFQAKIDSGYLYGRGASDMKAALAAMIVASERFIHQHPHFAGSIAFLITSDEEGTAINGTKKVIELLHHRGEKINYCIVGEPSSEKEVGDQIRIGRRGSLHGDLTIHGKQGHVAHPLFTENPIHRAALALHELAQTEWDKGNDSFPPTTFQMTNIHAGTGAKNVVPGHLELFFNFRFGTASTIQNLKERTQTILHKHGLTYDLKWTLGGEPFLTAHGKLVEVTQEAILEVSDLKTKLSTGGGTSDGRFIAPFGVEIIELGLSHATAHHVNECVKVEDIELLTNMYEAILKRLFLN